MKKKDGHKPGRKGERKKERAFISSEWLMMKNDSFPLCLYEIFRRRRLFI